MKSTVCFLGWHHEATSRPASGLEVQMKFSHKTLLPKQCHLAVWEALEAATPVHFPQIVRDDIHSDAAIEWTDREGG